MKLEARRVEAFLGAPEKTRAVLLYGDDVGLIRERAARLVKTVAGSLDDPFRIAELDRENAARISEEMASQSLVGGRRVVRVRDVADGMLPAVLTALNGPGDALLVLEAAGLPSRSKLRSALERAADAVAIACYPMEGAALEQVVAQSLQAAGVAVEPDARAWLAGQLGADQAVTRQEIEKLILYVGPGGRVDLPAAQICVGDLAGLSLDHALFSATAGDVIECDRAIELALAEGSSAVGVLRMTLCHLQRLQRARAAVGEGADARDAAKAVRPPLFYKREGAFVRALGLWSQAALEAACARVWEAEKLCKRTGNPAETLCRSIILGLAQRAAAARRR